MIEDWDRQIDLEPHGVALLCDAQGLVLQVLRNDLDLPDIVQGQLFLRLIEPASWSKALTLLTEIKAQGAVFDWELNVTRMDRISTLYFAGGMVSDRILLVGAVNGRFAVELYEVMTQISNEQTNMLRAMMQDRVPVSQTDIDQCGDLYDEVSRLNNELMAMQRELARKNAELARLNDLKNQFLGMAAHDLRNPLSIVLSYSEFLLESASALGPEQQHLLSQIHHLSQFMVHLVNDLLDVTAIESGQLLLDLWPADLTALVRDNVGRNRLLASRKGIEIDLEVVDLPPTLLDATKIEQVLDNLISNALKFSPPGSRVRVELARQDNQACLSVQDQGPGISPQDQERLFKPFQRTRAQSTDGEKSTGLGLVIVKRIVEGHGGRIELSSQVGQGSMFTVYLPLY